MDDFLDTNSKELLMKHLLEKVNSGELTILEIEDFLKKSINALRTLNDIL